MSGNGYQIAILEQTKKRYHSIILETWFSQMSSYYYNTRFEFCDKIIIMFTKTSAEFINIFCYHAILQYHRPRKTSNGGVKL